MPFGKVGTDWASSRGTAPLESAAAQRWCDCVGNVAAKAKHSHDDLQTAAGVAAPIGSVLADFGVVNHVLGGPEAT